MVFDEKYWFCLVKHWFFDLAGWLACQLAAQPASWMLGWTASCKLASWLPAGQLTAWLASWLSSVAWLASCLPDWPASWLSGWPADWPAGCRPAGCLAGQLALLGCLAGQLSSWPSGWPADFQQMTRLPLGDQTFIRWQEFLQTTRLSSSDS